MKAQEEKKQDEIEHNEPVNLDKNARVQVADIQEKRLRLQQLLSTLPLTSNFREDLVFYLKKWLISDFALRHNFKKILFGTTGH